MGEGVGALMALPLLQAAADTLADEPPTAYRAGAEGATRLPTAAELLGKL